MDVLRRNTDYALRAMLNLASHYGQEPVSTREVVRKEDISYHLACKMLQKLRKAKLVRSRMGPKGGFQLSRKPSKIGLLEVIEAIQGPVRLNRCLLGVDACPRRPRCGVSSKLDELQRHIESFLAGITLDELLGNSERKEQNAGKRMRVRK